MRPVELPTDLARHYTASGTTYGSLYALAKDLREQLAGAGRGPVCLATQDRVLAAAAVLASLSGGPGLVIPHALSGAVLAEARQATGFETTIDDKTKKLPDKTEKPPALTRPADEPFLSLFTGGSTGRPRVWRKTRANLLGEADLLAERFGISPDDLFLSTVPPLHIYGLLFSVLLPLVAGSRVLDRPAYLPAEIASLLAEERPTVFVSGPTHFHALRRTEIKAPDLRLAFSSGGMLDADDGARFADRTGVGVTEVYGSTETGGVATRCRQRGETDWTPLAGVRFDIRDERLLVASDFLSPELPHDERGMFATGDRAEPTAAGHFALLGRADGIVKVAGKRVDLLEVEQKLRSIEGVTDAHVLATESSAGRGGEIAALVVSEHDEQALRKSLAALLEPFAIPHRLLLVDSIPTTETGKRDRDAIEALLE